MYHRWTENGLNLWISYVDDCLNVGHPKDVEEARDRMLQEFDCDDIGKFEECIGCKIDINREERSLRITQPTLIQSFEDEFGAKASDGMSTPAIPGSVLKIEEGDKALEGEQLTKHRSGVGKLLHLVKWSRPEIKNVIRDLSRFMTGAATKHVKAMMRAVNHVVSAKTRGKHLKPEGNWDGKDRNFLFDVGGRSDSDFCNDPIARKSISGTSVTLNKAPVVERSRMQKCVTLSVTEAEVMAAVECAQDMLFAANLLESLGLKVKKPMILECDNKGAIELVHGWQANGRTRHVANKIHCLQELKENGEILMKCVKTEDN